MKNPMRIIPNIVRRRGDIGLDVPLAVYVRAGDADQVCIAEGTLARDKSVPLALADALEELAAHLREQADS